MSSWFVAAASAPSASANNCYWNPPALPFPVLDPRIASCQIKSIAGICYSQQQQAIHAARSIFCTAKSAGECNQLYTVSHHNNVNHQPANQPSNPQSKRSTCTVYKGSAPRAADASRYARARKNATETCKMGRKKRPMIWCEQQIDNAKSCLCRAYCPVLCCVLVGGVTF